MNFVKGALAVAQSGGPTPVLNTTLAGLLRQTRLYGRFEAVYGLAHGLEGALRDELLNLSRLSDDQLEQLSHTPAAALGSSRHKLTEAEYDRVLACFQRRGVRFLAYIGGNGSMWVAGLLAERAAALKIDLQVIGIPKTVDNDLLHTAFSPGYGSAARFMALATRDAGLDQEAMETFDDVYVLEAMGRDTGWLAAASALLKDDADSAPHLVYVPEIPFDETAFLESVHRVHRRLGRVFVVAGEGLRHVDGRPVGEMQGDGGHIDSLGRTNYSLTTGPAVYLARIAREQLGLQTRFLRPGLIGRSLSACVSPVDRAAAETVGRAAADALAAGMSGVMLGLAADGETSPVPLSEAASGIRRLPREYMDASGSMVTKEFRAYAGALIGDVTPALRLRHSVATNVQASGTINSANLNSRRSST